MNYQQKLKNATTIKEVQETYEKAVTRQLENQKDFLLNQKNYEQDKLLDIYVELINQWGLFTHFISRKEIYNYTEIKES